MLQIYIYIASTIQHFWLRHQWWVTPWTVHDIRLRKTPFVKNLGPFACSQYIVFCFQLHVCCESFQLPGHSFYSLFEISFSKTQYSNFWPFAYRTNSFLPLLFRYTEKVEWYYRSTHFLNLMNWFKKYLNQSKKYWTIVNYYLVDAWKQSSIFFLPNLSSMPSIMVWDFMPLGHQLRHDVLLDYSYGDPSII